MDADQLDGDIRWNKAPCRFCGVGCHVQVGVDQGKVVAIAGDKHADVNKGLLCVKGYHVGAIMYGKDRLTKPLLRQGDDLVEISWEQAIDTIARRIMRAPEKFAFYGSGQWTIPEGYAAQKFMKGGLGNNHIDPNARLCMASAVTGFIATYGVDEPAGCYEDLDACDVLINWGNNPAENHPVLFSRVIDRPAHGVGGREKEVRVIDIGTRRTRTSELATEFVLMKPQGDVALALGIMHLLVAENRYDAEFVEKHCHFRALQETNPTLLGEAISFDEFKRRISRYTPEYVAELSGISTSKIRELADVVRRPRAAHHQPLVHGHEPAHHGHRGQRPGARRSFAERAFRQTGRCADQPDGTTLGLRDRPRGGHAGACASRRAAGGQSGAPRSMRAALESPCGADQPDTRLRHH